MSCQFCGEPAVASAWVEVAPPLCEKHLDLKVLADYLRDREQPVTQEAVKALIRLCQARNGVLALRVEDVDGLWGMVEGSSEFGVQSSEFGVQGG